MNRIVALMLVLGLLLAVVASGCTASVKSEQEMVVAEIKDLDGKVTVDEKSADKPVIVADLHGTRITDAGLEHLRGLTKLQRLNLSFTEVTDAGLDHLKGLT